MNKQRFVFIAAFDEKRGIGKEGKIPWRSKSDLQNFKVQTWGGTLLMGRKTYESIGKPLPSRWTYILTRNPSYRIPEASGVHVATNGQHAHTDVALCKSAADVGFACVLPKLEADGVATTFDAGIPVFVVGGQEVYEQVLALLLPRKDVRLEAVLTHVEGDFGCDTFFPGLDDTWKKIGEFPFEQRPGEPKATCCQYIRTP